MRDLQGKVAAITGAGSGIGRALAQELAAAGCRLSLSDVDREGLAKTTAGLPGDPLRHRSGTVDVSDVEQVRVWAEDTAAYFGAVDIVINNAGTGMQMPLQQTRLEDLHWIIDINFWGVVHGSMAFLPFLSSRPEAILCNVASVFSLFTYPNAGGYCASKAAVRAYTQTLAQELAGSSVRVCCVYPGGVRTNIARNSRLRADATEEERRLNAVEFEKNLARTTPEQAAAAIVRGIRQAKPRILVGADARVFDFASRLMPETWQRLARLFHSEQS